MKLTTRSTPRAAVRLLAGTTAIAAICAAASPAAAQQPDYDLDTLRVGVASRAATAMPVATRAVEIVTAEQLSRMPARTINDLLAWPMGMDMRQRSPAQADLGMRGSSFEQVLVLVDGMRVSDAQTGHFDLDLPIPLAEIERIEILRGPASAVYGSDAMGGVVNIVTRDAAVDGTRSLYARVDGGSFGTAGAEFGADAGIAGLGLRTAAEIRRSDGHRDGTDYRISSVRAGLTAPLGERTLEADLAVGARDFGAALFYTSNPEFDEYEETRTALLSFGLAAPLDAGFALEPRFSVRRHDDEFLLMRSDPSFYRNQHTSWQLGGELVGRHARLGDSFGLAIGAEAYRDLLESNSLGDREETRAAGFAEIVAGDPGRAAVTAGLRTDWHSAYGTFVAPSLSGAFRPADRLRLRASAGRAFRAPTWTDRFYESPANIGNPDLEPERSRTFELGVDLTAAPGLSISLDGFMRQAEALIDWGRPLDSPESEPFRALNVHDATIQGLELRTEAADLIGTRWVLRATGLTLESEVESGYDSRYALRPLTRSISLEASRDLIGGLSASARGMHARRSGESGYLLLDARVSLQAGDGLRFDLDLLNLLDDTYLDPSARPAAGRAVYLGVSWLRGD